MAKKKSGKVLCYRCNGSGKVLVKLGYAREPKSYKSFWNKCRTCNGSGKIEWIDNICKKEESFYEWLEYE